MFDFMTKPLAATLMVLLTTTAVPAQEQTQPDAAAPEAAAEAPAEETTAMPAETTAEAAEATAEAAEPMSEAAEAAPEATEPMPEAAETATEATETMPEAAEPAPVADPVVAEESPAMEAAPAETAAPTCSAMQVLEDGIPAARRTATLAADGLVTNQNVYRAHDTLADAVRDELEGSEYEAACFNGLLTLASADASPDLDGVSPNQVTDAIVAVWADQCEANTTPDGVIACLNDILAADQADLLTDQQIYKLSRSLPVEEVTFDDAQLTTMLGAIKSAVDAGTINSGQQTSMVNKLLGQ